jgi:tungstate transport system ATP-binding protein
LAKIISVKNLDKSFGETSALNGINLDIEEGGIITLVGVNGSGKTTLLRILAGLDEPTRGEILYREMKISAKEMRRIATLVFQKSVMFNRNVFENISFGLKARGFRKEQIDSKVLEALEYVGLKNFEKRRAKRLSGGEQQRIALARAFVCNPKLLLLDEPTSNLDPANAIIIENFIKKVSEKKDSSIIVSTHNLFQAKRISTKIAHIYRGEILDSGVPRDFFSNPKNNITKSFLNGELQF